MHGIGGTSEGENLCFKRGLVDVAQLFDIHVPVQRRKNNYSTKLFQGWAFRSIKYVQNKLNDCRNEVFECQNHDFTKRDLLTGVRLRHRLGRHSFGGWFPSCFHNWWPLRLLVEMPLNIQQNASKGHERNKFLCPNVNYLVVSIHLENISQIGSFPQGSGWSKYKTRKEAWCVERLPFQGNTMSPHNHEKSKVWVA